MLLSESTWRSNSWTQWPSALALVADVVTTRSMSVPVNWLQVRARKSCITSLVDSTSTMSSSSLQRSQRIEAGTSQWSSQKRTGSKGVWSITARQPHLWARWNLWISSSASALAMDLLAARLNRAHKCKIVSVSCTLIKTRFSQKISSTVERMLARKAVILKTSLARTLRLRIPAKLYCLQKGSFSQRIERLINGILITQGLVALEATKLQFTLAEKRDKVWHRSL